MGNVKALKVGPACKEEHQVGKTCIRVEFNDKGSG
jgi:hypothetical protein